MSLYTAELLVKAYEAATQSPDLSTQNGALLLTDNGDIFTGCNTFPVGVAITNERLQRPGKYAFTEHAERNAIFAAAKAGVTPDGGVLYCPWAACADCARAIAIMGVKKVVTHGLMMRLTPPHWKESIAFANQILQEAGVELEEYYEELPDAPKIRFNGELWKPVW